LRNIAIAFSFVKFGSAGGVGHRPWRRGPREQLRLDQGADDVPGNDVQLLDKRRRVGWRTQAKIA
jgi:hypothetical protein